MSSSVVDEVLFAYITVAPHAVNLVLIQVDSGIQWSVYYVSKYYIRPRFIIYHWKSHGVSCYTKASPLLSSIHSCCPNSASA